MKKSAVKERNMSRRIDDMLDQMDADRERSGYMNYRDDMGDLDVMEEDDVSFRHGRSSRDKESYFEEVQEQEDELLRAVLKDGTEKEFTKKAAKDNDNNVDLDNLPTAFKLQIKAFERNDELLMQKYDQYIAGELPEYDWKEFVWMQTEYYIRNLATHWCGGRAGDEDLLQSGRAAVCFNAPRYDPNKGKITTFFSQLILNEFRDQTKYKALSKDLQKKMRQINNILIKKGFREGMHDPEFLNGASIDQNAKRICEITKFPYETVCSILRLKDVENVSLEYWQDNIAEGDDIASPFLSPEDAAMQNQTTQLVRRVLKDNFSPFDIWLITKFIMQKGASYRRVVQFLNEHPDFRERIGYPPNLQLHTQALQTRVSELTLLLKSNKELKRWVGRDRDSGVNVDKQAYEQFDQFEGRSLEDIAKDFDDEDK